MIRRVCFRGKCWKFTHTKPLPRVERRAERLTLILRTFLIGDLGHLFGTGDRVGIEKGIG
jgi:hypothetical protein